MCLPEFYGPIPGPFRIRLERSRKVEFRFAQVSRKNQRSKTVAADTTKTEAEKTIFHNVENGRMLYKISWVALRDLCKGFNNPVFLDS